MVNLTITWLLKFLLLFVIIKLLVYQVNNAVAGPIYNKSHNVYDTLKFDIYENSDIVSNQIFDTQLNKGIDDTIDLDVIQDYQDTPNLNEYPHVEL